MPSLGHQLAVNLDEMRKKARTDVDQTWTKANAEVIAFPEPVGEKIDLPGIRRVGGTGFEPPTPAL